jgi:aryl-alcohol dehydrogenase-like predicted oxidoreductase
MNTTAIKEKVAQYRLKTQDSRSVPLGIGCAWVGKGESYLDTLDQDLKVMMACYERGFRYFDTSRYYGNSEQTVGEMVKRIPRDSIYLATKSPYPRVEGSRKRNFEVFKSNFYQSFERLQTDHIDLFQIHDTDHYECCVKEVIPFLLERQAEGLISYIGMGTVSLNAHENAIRSGYVQSSLSYLNYSILKKSAARLIEICRQYGAAFINASVFHYGLIRAEDPLAFQAEYNPPHIARNRVTAAAMQSLCKKLGIPVLAAALQISLFNPGIDMTLIGTGRMENLNSTFESLNTIIHPEHWAAITALMEAQPFLYVEDGLYD